MPLVYQPGSVLIVSPTGNERVEADSGGAMLAEVSIGSMRDASGYQKAVPLTGATLTIGSSTVNQSVLAVNPAGGLAALTIILPAAPVDGQRALIFTSQAITALTMQAPGTTLNNPVTSLTANQSVEWLWSLSNNTWDRIQ
jgi:hypothetical protein